MEHDSLLAIEWFENNYIKLNQEKCHLLVSGNKSENIWAESGHAKIWENPKQKLIVSVIDRDLSFDRYVSSLCRKAGIKLSALARLSHYMNLKYRTVLLKSFIEAQFGYCQLIWMFHTIELNRKINYIHERALRIVYRDNSSSFIELPKKDNSVFIHYRNIQSLAIELYKVKHTFSNFLILDIIPLRSVDYNLRTQTDFLYKYQLVRSEITNFFLQKCGI